jgi:ribosomal protein S15P/S13E
MSRRQQLQTRMPAIIAQYQRTPGDLGSPEVQSEWWTFVWGCASPTNMGSSPPPDHCYPAATAARHHPCHHITVALLTEQIRDKSVHVLANKKDHVSKQ